MQDNREYQRCNRCVMDTTDKDITFDEHGVCNRCHEYDERIAPWWNHGRGHEDELAKIIQAIKKSGEGKEYDCLIGLSGGLDSTYVLHMAVKEWGLRPFVFHVDAGWDLPVTVSNLKKVCNKIGVKLHTEKLDFNEVRQMQVAFFKTGHGGLDVPQDHAFIAMVDRFASEIGVKYILNGYNIATEVVANPASWYVGAGPTADKTYVKDVLKKHGNIKTKNYTFTTGFRHKFWLPYVKGIKTLTLLNYIPITKKEMIQTLAEEYDYEPYGQKHFEDLLTKFLEGWWAPTRFGTDIRIAWLSSLIITGQMTRDEALEILDQPPLSEEESKKLFKQVAEKLEISEKELMSYHELPHEYLKYKNNRWAFRLGIKIYTALGLDKRIRK